jgi:non-specific serine/threonine protein kinase
VVTNAIYQSQYFWSYAFFAEHYKVPMRKKQDENRSGTQNLVSPFILKRSFKDLPNSEQVFYCDMEPEQEKL